MAHARKQIRDAAVALLAGLASTGTRVFHGRVRPLPADHDPYLLVYAFEETIEPSSIGRPIALDRFLTLAVEGRAVSSGVPDDILDQIAAEVEAALAADPTLGVGVLDTQLIAVRINVEAPGEKQAGEVRMEFRVHYRTRENAPEIIV